MKKSYFPETGIWLKGNLHCHTTVSDGALTPEETCKGYRNHGYDFLSMTDHNVFVPHCEVPQEELVLLTGVEHDLEYSRNKCTHVVGTGLSSKQQTGYICRKYTCTELADQQLIDMMRNDGQFVVLAHPVWSRMEPEEVAALSGFHAMEVYNNGTENLCHAGHAEIYWDMLLRRGMRVFATASDDTHEPCDLYGGWIIVKAESKSYDAVLDALFNGHFYASSGPSICEYGTEDNRVYFSCSPCKEIHIVSYPPRGKSFFAKEGEVLTECSFARTGEEQYVRIECIDQNGKTAWTNPLFFD